MTQRRARETQGREHGHDHITCHRPRGAAARRRWILLQTQGLSRKGGWLAGIIRPVARPLPFASHGITGVAERSRTSHLHRLARLELGNVLGRQGIEGEVDGSCSFEQCSSFVRGSLRQGRLPRGAMNHKVGIWIDHKKAVIVSASGDRITAETLESDVGPHTRYSGPQDGGGEK
jgi:hypothetical protein